MSIGVGVSFKKWYLVKKEFTYNTFCVASSFYFSPTIQKAIVFEYIITQFDWNYPKSESWVAANSSHIWQHSSQLKNFTKEIIQSTEAFIMM